MLAESELSAMWDEELDALSGRVEPGAALTHDGIKFAKLEAYADFFLYRWSHVRKGGMKDAIACVVSRVYGTPKSHVYADSFRKSSK